jgi:hypothetical protein
LFGSSLSVLGFVELASIVIWMLLPLWILWQNSVCRFMYWQLTSTHHSQQLMNEDAKMEISSLVAGQYKSCCCCWRSLNMHECHCLCCSCSAYSLLSFFFFFLRFYAWVSSFCFSCLLADILSDLKSL